MIAASGQPLVDVTRLNGSDALSAVGLTVFLATLIGLRRLPSRAWHGGARLGHLATITRDRGCGGMGRDTPARVCG